MPNDFSPLPMKTVDLRFLRIDRNTAAIEDFAIKRQLQVRPLRSPGATFDRNASLNLRTTQVRETECPGRRLTGFCLTVQLLSMNLPQCKLSGFLLKRNAVMAG